MRTHIRSIQTGAASLGSTCLEDELFQSRAINSAAPQREYVRYFLARPLGCTTHFVNACLVFAGIARIELSRYEHAVIHSVAFMVIHTLKGYSPMGVRESAFHLHARIEAPARLLGKHAMYAVHGYIAE